MVGTSRTISTPGVSVGTMNIEARCDGAGVGVGDGHDDQEVGDRAVRGEPLVPVDHPVLAVAHARACAAASGPSPGVSGSVMQNALRRSPASSGCSQRSFCSARAGHREDLRVAGVRRGVAERQRRDRRGAEDLVHQPQLHLAHALPAELGRQVRRPQAALLDLLLQRRDRPHQPVEAELVPDRLQRPDLAADELGHPVELLLVVGVGGEVPAHQFESFGPETGLGVETALGVAFQPTPCAWAPGVSAGCASGSRGRRPSSSV